jgi:hypothetical protein
MEERAMKHREKRKIEKLNAGTATALKTLLQDGVTGSLNVNVIVADGEIKHVKRNVERFEV